MRSRAGRIGVVLLCVVTVLALGLWAATILLRPHLPSPRTITLAMRAQASLSGGAKVYVSHCAYCHDTGFAPGLSQLHFPAAAMRSVVRQGPGMMPAFPPSEVSDADIDAAASYISILPADRRTP